MRCKCQQQRFLMPIIGIVLTALACLSTARAQEAPDYGKPGAPINLAVGYQPYYAEAWSGMILKAKGFWKKRLPPGSTVEFEIGIQGSVVVGEMFAGKLQIGYLGDMPAIIAAARPEIADIRIIAALGTSQQQCNVFLARKDAPAFKSAEDAVRWLDGKVVASPQGSCTDRFAQKVFQTLKIRPRQYYNQSADQMVENFKAGKLDAAVVWEPISSRFIAEGLVRRVASGVNFNESDGGFLVMNQDLITARPDVEKAWLEAELDAQLFLADPKNSGEIAAIAESETKGYTRQALWSALYGDYPHAVGGSPERMVFDFVLPPTVKQQVNTAAEFLYGLKRIPAPTLRETAFADDAARSVLEGRGLASPIGIVKSQPLTAFTQ